MKIQNDNAKAQLSRNNNGTHYIDSFECILTCSASRSLGKHSTFPNRAACEANCQVVGRKPGGPGREAEAANRVRGEGDRCATPDVSLSIKAGAATIPISNGNRTVGERVGGRANSSAKGERGFRLGDCFCGEFSSIEYPIVPSEES